MNDPTPVPPDPITTLGMKLTKSCKYVFEEQGFLVWDIMTMLHGVMGQVLSWVDKDDPEDEDDDEDDEDDEDEDVGFTSKDEDDD